MESLLSNFDYWTALLVDISTTTSPPKTMYQCCHNNAYIAVFVADLDKTVMPSLIGGGSSRLSFVVAVHLVLSAPAFYFLEWRES